MWITSLITLEIFLVVIMSLLNFGFQRRKRKIDDADEKCDDNQAMKVLNIEVDQQSVDVNMFAGKGQFLCVLYFLKNAWYHVTL